MLIFNEKSNTTNMNFEQTLNTLRDWQKEENESRSFVYLIADKNANDVRAATGGLAIPLAEGLAAMIGKLPYFDKVLQLALSLYAMRQNDKAVEKFLTEEVKAAQEQMQREAE